MIRLLARAALAAALLAAAPALAQSQLDQVQGQNGPVTSQPVQAVIHNGGTPCVVGSPGCNLPAFDANNASFSSAVALSVGGAPLGTPARSIDAECSVAGTATVTVAGGGSIVWQVVVGSQDKPWRATGVSATTATCIFYGLN